MYSSLHPNNPVRLTTESIFNDLENAVGELFIYADEATYDSLRHKFKTEYLNKFLVEIQYARDLAITRAIQLRKTDNYSE